MRLWVLTLIALITLSAGACSREDVKRNERELGKEAYQAKQKSKAAAERAARELRQAGQEAHKGWNDAKREGQRKREQK